MIDTIMVEPKTCEWVARRPDGDRRSVEHVISVMMRWAERHARRRHLLHTSPQAEYLRDPMKRETRIYVTLEYAVL